MTTRGFPAVVHPAAVGVWRFAYAMQRTLIAYLRQRAKSEHPLAAQHREQEQQHQDDEQDEVDDAVEHADDGLGTCASCGAALASASCRAPCGACGYPFPLGDCGE